MSPTRKGALLSVGSALCAALFLIPFKQANELVARDVVVMTTMLVAAVLNTTIVVARGTRGLRFDAVSLRTALVLGLLTISGNIGAALALIYVGAGVTSIVQQTQILFVAVGGYVLLGEYISRRFAFGAAIVLAGIVLIQLSSHGIQGGVDSAMNTFGILGAVLSAVSFAAMHIMTRKVINRIQPVTVNAVRLWISVAILLSLPGNTDAMRHLDGQIWLLCAVAAFVGPFLARIGLMFAVKYISASHVTLITLVTPVFAFTLDFAILGTRPTLWHLLGCAIVMFGVGIPILELIRRDAATKIHRTDGAALDDASTGDVTARSAALDNLEPKPGD